MPLTSHSTRSSEGDVHYLFSSPTNSTTPALPTLLLIHGNSSSSQIFADNILASSRLTSRYTIVAVDLPGHGYSSRAKHPRKTYTQQGYAQVILGLLSDLRSNGTSESGVDDSSREDTADGVRLASNALTIIGWSLGGHIAIELVHLLRTASPFTDLHILGVLLIGTPPALGLAQTSRGFKGKGDPSAGKHMHLAAQETITREEAETFVREQIGRGKYQQWMGEVALRTDGRARKIMFDAFNDEEAGGVDQRAVVEDAKTGVLWGVVNGAEEPFVDLEYLDEIKWARLWRDKCVRLEGLGHASFYEDWDATREWVEGFVEECGSLSQTT